MSIQFDVDGYAVCSQFDYDDYFDMVDNLPVTVDGTDSDYLPDVLASATCGNIISIDDIKCYEAMGNNTFKFIGWSFNDVQTDGNDDEAMYEGWYDYTEMLIEFLRVNNYTVII